MKAYLSRSRDSRGRGFTPPVREWAPRLNLAEGQFHTVVAELEERIVHHCDRPEIEVRILDFISHAQGPSTEGIAAEMRISPAAADVHLRELRRAKRIWGQPIRGGGMAWYISQRGKQFLGEKSIVWRV